MSRTEKENLEKGKAILRHIGVNFSFFKAQASPWLANPLNEDEWVQLYNQLAHDKAVCANAETLPLKKWLRHYGSQLFAMKIEVYADANGWIRCEERLPKENLGVLVFIPDEDTNITSGMYDVSKSWVLLDEYRNVGSSVTHWQKLPNNPVK